MNVSVVTAKVQDVPVNLSSNANVSALASLDLRPQITSTISKIHVKEGQLVQRGQLLFTLDQRNELANLQRAKAQLQKDQAGMQDLERQLQRSTQLVAQKFITQSASDTLQSQVQAQRATLALGQASLQSAQVALDYTEIRAPFSGRVGAIPVFPGSLVQTSTSLTQIAQINPVNLNFTIAEEHLSALRRAQAEGEVVVETSIEGKQLRGKLSFIDNSVDPQAGVIRLKAEFPNQQELLWPGQYLNAKLTVSTIKNAVVVPMNAIITNARGKSVLTMEADQSAKMRPITIVHAFGPYAAVSGLSGGEKVIVDGKQNLRPGSKVKELSNTGGNGKSEAAASAAGLAPAASGKQGSAK